ncbi:9484_t:CDS:2, partial [Acaulospora colombiana]
MGPRLCQDEFLHSPKGQQVRERTRTSDELFFVLKGPPVYCDYPKIEFCESVPASSNKAMKIFAETLADPAREDKALELWELPVSEGKPLKRPLRDGLYRQVCQPPESAPWNKEDAVKAMLHPRVKVLILNTYGVDLDDALNDALNEALALATNLLGLAVQTASYFHWRKRLTGPLLRKLTHLSIQSITE